MYRRLVCIRSDDDKAVKDVEGGGKAKRNSATVNYRELAGLKVRQEKPKMDGKPALDNVN